MNGPYLDWIAQESDSFVAAIAAEALDRQVPACPDWKLHDLVAHMGRVQRFWARAVRAGEDREPTWVKDVPPDGAESTALQAWMRASTRELLDALGDTPAETPAWTWWKESRNAGAIARHQVQEAAVHRWDAQSVTGTSEALPRDLADDGVDEFLWIARQMRVPASVTFHCTDTGRVVIAGVEPSAVTVSASASDLVLLLHGRVALDAVVVDGPRAVVEGFLVKIE
jgi:uncharacterized protein (TIGR03083 family)